MTLSAFLREPLQGKTSLSKVFWLYGVLGSILYSTLELFFDAGNESFTRIYVVGGLLFSVYVTLATHRCAMNCRSAFLGRWVRLSAAISLLALPVIAYLEFTGAFGAALSMMSGEQ
ncbi:MAG TPA: hypothetical protein VGO37_19485 [Steroidobacteraceae bacterium]|jgi:hypothetical protein|nr:hypothetical protein [Steroidobacteraceae bacterium]